MKRILLAIFAVCIVYTSAGTTKAEAPERLLKDYSVPELVSHFALQYKVSAIQMLATMNCESFYEGIPLNPNAIGDHGTSYGLVQIHLPAHLNVTKEEALDKVFATEFMAKEFSEKHERIWSCYRKLYP